MLNTGQTVDVTAVWINYKQPMPTLLPGTSFFALSFECFPQIFEEFVSSGSTEASPKKEPNPCFCKTNLFWSLFWSHSFSSCLVFIFGPGVGELSQKGGKNQRDERVRRCPLSSSLTILAGYIYCFTPEGISQD